VARDFIHPNACGPMALSQLFGETFEQACNRIVEAGGRPNAVTKGVFDRLLAPHGVRQRRIFKRVRVFHSWRREKLGAWVVVVTGIGDRAGHCIALRDGRPMDNGWVRFEPGRRRYESLRVHAAWQI
jgi:hypothetical protein